MNRRKLLKPKDKKDKHESDSTPSSLFNVIKKRESFLIFNQFRGSVSGSKKNEALRSIISSEKNKLYPLGRLLNIDNKLSLMHSLHSYICEKISESELFGYISRENALALLGGLDHVKSSLGLNLHIFSSDLVRRSSIVFLFRGRIDDNVFDLLINRKSLNWFVSHADTSNIALSQRVLELSLSLPTDSFVDESFSFLLINSMFLPNSLVVPHSFFVIY